MINIKEIVYMEHFNLKKDEMERLKKKFHEL